MYRGVCIAAVVPAYREEAHIADVIKTMPDFVDHIVVVDDASPDRTAQAALDTRDPRLHLIRHDRNQGVGSAKKTAHHAALELGADIDVVMDGDGQMDPAHLPSLLDPVVDGYGFAKGNRFFSVGSWAGMPRYRVVGNVALSFLTKSASGYWHVFDPQNGYTAIRTDVLRRLPLDRIASGYSYENDLLVYLNILGVPVADVPIPALYAQEESDMRLRRVVPELLWELFRGFWRRIWWKYLVWSFSPVALLLLTGLFLILGGSVDGLFVSLASIGAPEPTAGTVMLAVVPFVVGVQTLLVALQLDIQASPDKPSLPPLSPPPLPPPSSV